MPAITSLMSGNAFAQGFAKAASRSVRPNLELQINILQNAVIDRLNKKIEEVNADFNLKNANLDVSLRNSSIRMQQFVQRSERYLFDNGRNMLTTDGLVSELSTLDAALQANDTATFNSTLEKVNWMVGMMHDSQGFAVGLYVDDGIKQLQVDGLLKYDNAGTPARATTRADFASDAEASAAILSALDETTRLGQVLSYNQDAGEGLRDATQQHLTNTILQLEVAASADQAQKSAEIEKVRLEYGQLLNAISLAFESSASLTERIGAALFEPPELQPGSIMNMFA